MFTFELAQANDLAAIIQIAQNYPEDFATYLDPLPGMVNMGKVFVVKRQGTVIGFATYGISNKDPLECMTASARMPGVSRQELSGDWLRARIEEALRQRGFLKFTAHVRKDNSNAIKMLIRNGYRQVANSQTATDDLLEFSKAIPPLE